MARLISFNSGLHIGDFLNRWFENKTIRRNQNIILAVTGGTGTGKTYNSLSTGENWYEYKFNDEFPIENVCFSLSSLMKRIISLKKEKRLRKGELFILEEAGANFGNLDFQQKMSKMFSYILQSFRNMNIILILTVPVLSMINKSARLLIHAHFITEGINYETKIAKIKPYMHQLSQATGKSYWKYPRIRMNRKILTIKRINFTIPSKRLTNLYESKKETFVFDLSVEFIEEADKIEREKNLKLSRKELTDKQREVFKLACKGLNQIEIGESLGKAQQSISEILKLIKNKGYRVEIAPNP